ncbi:MAG TPA: HEAT repeat domain-containing protein [Polyangia bacterium]
MRLASLVVVVLISGAAQGAQATQTTKAGKASRTSRMKKAAPAEAKKAAPVLPAEKLAKVRELLLGDDDTASVEAAKALGQSGASNALEPLVDLLSVGAAPARAEAAVEALGALGDPRAIDVLELYAGHQMPEVRRRAVRALASIKDERVVPALLGALGDAAPDVRATAADALAARKETKAGPRLLALVKRNDAGAAPALGLLASPELVPQLAELQGTVDDNVVASALGEYIKRDDVSDSLRVDVVRTIGRLSGAAATTALVEYLGSVPAKDDRPSKKEAQKLVDDKGTPK